MLIEPSWDRHLPSFRTAELYAPRLHHKLRKNWVLQCGYLLVTKVLMANSHTIHCLILGEDGASFQLLYAHNPNKSTALNI
jgi:hypothetical protein